MEKTPPQSHPSECPDPYSKWFCLNGATCFSINIREAILYNCWCANGYHGSRCEQKYDIMSSRYEEESNTGPSSLVDRLTTLKPLQLGFQIVESHNDARIKTSSRRFAIANSKQYVLGYQSIVIFLLIVLVIFIFKIQGGKLVGFMRYSDINRDPPRPKSVRNENIQQVRTNPSVSSISSLNYDCESSLKADTNSRLKTHPDETQRRQCNGISGVIEEVRLDQERYYRRCEQIVVAGVQPSTASMVAEP